MKKINTKLIAKQTIHFLKQIGSDADRDWKIALSAFIILFFAIVLLSVNTFFNVQSQKDTGATAQGKKTEFINAKALSDVLKAYDRRQQDFLKLASTTRALVDPAR